MTGQGIDISEWQGHVDDQAVHNAGVDFEVIRCAFGLGHPDPFFSENWAGAKAAGIARAAYLWYRDSQDPLSQAAFLASSAAGSELPPWVDAERIETSSARFLVGLAQLLGELERRDGRVPVLYTGPAFWISLGKPDPAWARYPLAVAHYTTAAGPTVPAPWPAWTYWQHTSAGRVPGIGGLVDLDVSVTPLWTAAPAQPKEHPYMHLNASVVAIVVNPAGAGYWEIAGDGGVFAFGGALGFPNNPLPSQHLNAPIVDAKATPTGQGLLLVGADGGVFTLGDAAYAGSVPEL